MLDATHRPAVVTTLPVGSQTAVFEVLAAIEADLAEGSVGVVLEPVDPHESQHVDHPGEPFAEVIPGALIIAAARLTAVTVTVGSPEQAEAALRCGATGIMVHSVADTRLCAVAAEYGAWVWLTGLTGPPPHGPAGGRLVLECPVGAVSTVAAALGARGPRREETRLACGLPGSTSLDDGALEALVTLAIAGGATVLRCAGSAGHVAVGDVRLVRRCADVAMELTCAGVAPAGYMPTADDGREVAS